MARTSLGPWKFVRDMSSSSHWGLIMTSVQEAKAICVRAIEVILYIVLQHDESVHDFSDTDTHRYLYSIRLQWYMYIHNPSVKHGFKMIVISKEPVVYHCYKNGWKTCCEYWRNESLHKSSHKTRSFGKADFFTELGDIYGFNNVSYETVRRWTTGNCKTNVSKVREIIENDGRYIIHLIAKAVGISLLRVYFILKRILKVRKISARWIPHLLTDEQKTHTNGQTMLLVRKNNGKQIWLSKDIRRPVVAKRTMSTKKVLCAIFFSCDGIAIQVLLTKGKSVTGRYYCDCDLHLKKLKKYYHNRRPVTGFQHVCLLHYNASAHTSEIVKQFLMSEKVTFLPHPPYSPDLAPHPHPRDFFLFPKLKSSYLFIDITPGKPLAQPSASVSEVYSNQHTVTHFRSGFTDWSYVFPTADNTLKGYKVNLIIWVGSF